MDIGWITKPALDLISETAILIKSLDETHLKLKGSLEEAQYSYKVAKANQVVECPQ